MQIPGGTPLGFWPEWPEWPEWRAWNAIDDRINRQTTPTSAPLGRSNRGVAASPRVALRCTLGCPRPCLRHGSTCQILSARHDRRLLQSE